MKVTIVCDRHGTKTVRFCDVDEHGYLTVPAEVALPGAGAPGEVVAGHFTAADLRRAAKRADRRAVEAVYIAPDGTLIPLAEADHYAYRTGVYPRERQSFTCPLCGDRLVIKRERWAVVFDHLTPGAPTVALDGIRAILSGK